MKRILSEIHPLFALPITVIFCALVVSLVAQGDPLADDSNVGDSAKSDQQQRRQPPGREADTGSSEEEASSQQKEGKINSDHREGFLKSGPLSIFQNLGLLADPFQPLLRSLAPIPHLARAPFVQRAQTRLELDALNHVELGDFSQIPSQVPLDGSLSEEAASEAPIRVVSWNIERGLQYERVLEILQDELRADVYLLQEVDRDARRTEFRDVARGLAAELGMFYAFGIEFQELIQGKAGQPAVHGQATLSRFPILSARVLRFSTQPKDWSQDWFQPREGGRIALVTEIETPSGRVVMYNAHLESRGKDRGRREQMGEILSDFGSARSGVSLLVAGDLNTGQGLASPVFKLAQEQGLELLQFKEPLSLREARKQKDWILAAGVHASAAILHRQIAASDHKPVSVWLRLRSE